MVRSKVKWNKENTRFIKDPQKALKEGVGNSAQINALLISALKDAGFDAFPVLMRLRTSGRLPLTHPSDQFNYFIAGVSSNNNTYYLDATRPYTDINVLPVACLVDKAFCLHAQKNEWADLSTLANNTTRTTLHISFDEDAGVMEGLCSRLYSNQPSYRFQQEFTDAKSQDDYVKTLEEKSKIRITDYKSENAKNNTALLSNESYKFTAEDISLNNRDIVSFSPLLFLAMNDNPFKQEKRELPVEFPYLYENKIDVKIILPEGYAFDEIPSGVKYVCKDKDGNIGSFTYIVKQEDYILNISCIFSVDSTIIPGIRYADFREFWSKVYTKTNEPVVFKKITGN
jgi:hypothetical protein